MKKRALALALALVLCLSLLPATALAAGDFTIENGVLTKYNGSGGDVTIPNGVTEVGNYAFSFCTKMTSVTIPDSVTVIGKDAFRSCRGLTSITIPGSVTVIEENAFYSCANLANIVIPDSGIKIERNAFEGTPLLENQSDDLVIIGGNLLKYQGHSDDVTIPSGVTIIGWGAFSDCISLNSVAIPDSVTEINLFAFFGCNNLTRMDVDSGNTTYKSVDGVLFSKDGTVIHAYPAGKSEFSYYTIPDGVTEVGAEAFSNCTSLMGITIPDGVTKIGDNAFSSCSNLTSLTIPDSVTEIEGAAFASCASLTSITIPKGVTKIESNLFRNCGSLTSVNIPDGVTVIGGEAFQGCVSLISVTIPDSVTEIQWSAFASCKSLTSITIPDSVTEIGMQSFIYCSGLTSITLSGSLTKIGEYAFAGCTNLTSVTMPDSVTTIEAEAFESCSNLTDVYYSGSETQWKAINIGMWNDALINATIHYNSVMPDNPTPSANTAYASTQGVGVDGKTVEFQAYALKDANGNDTNYIKLRDVAQVLNGTDAKFNVGWDGATSTITVTSGESYQSNGSEMSTPFSGNRTYEVSQSKLTVNGKTVDVEAILLKDDSGNGYTYFKLRDLGKALNFNVSWLAGTGIVINTDQPYSDAN